MKKIHTLSFSLLILGIFSCQNEEVMTIKGFLPMTKDTTNITYPITQKDDKVIDDYFGTQVLDPYRWLEDDNSSETADWVSEQNKVTDAYLSRISFRDDVYGRLENLYDFEKVSRPFKEGDYTYFYKNDGLQNHSVVYRKKGDKEEVFLDPNTFSEDGTTSLAGLSFSKDGSLAAVSLSEGGSDWRKVYVLDADTKEIIGDTLQDIKFSGISWQGNTGFYYSSYEKPDGSELSAKTDHHKVFFHELNTPQSADAVIFGNDPSQKHRYVFAYLTEDEEYLVLGASQSTSGNKLYVRKSGELGSSFTTILDNEDSDTYVLDHKSGKLTLVTNLDAPNQKIVTTEVSNPTPGNWSDLIPETENVLRAAKGGGYLFTDYKIDAISKVFQYDFDGNLVKEIELPGVGSAYGFSGKEEDEELYFTFTNYVTPSTIYKYNLEDGSTEMFWRPDIDFDSDQYESKQVFYTSKDGTKVPMIITHKKGLALDGTNPTILYGYGGFNVSLNPGYRALLPVWLEQGGIYAVPNIRGGGEYGKAWHDAGTKLDKQNVFDDFIAAAEFLIEEGYTSSEKLAINGGSNGGLLVGACMTQRPDLFQVAVPQVGVLDMLRYHTFTSGAGWAYDYGTSEDDAEMFNYLLGYSPVHNVKEGTPYPATLITTGDHDDRVVPAHSYKFAAELQNKASSPNPLLIRIETKAGHGAGKSTDQILEEWADIYSFIMYNVGVKPSY